MIQAQYKLTYEEWAEAQDKWCKPEAKSLPGIKLLQWVYIALCFTTGMALALPPHWPGIAIMLLLVLQSRIVSWRQKRLRRDLYDRNNDRDKETDLQIDESGYHSIKLGFNECRMTWQCFTGWVEGPLTFILGRGWQYCSVPKRALTEAQVIELRNLIRSKLG
jgi:hypothetical protein